MSFLRNVFDGYNGAGKPLSTSQRVVLAATEPTTARWANSITEFGQRMAESERASHKARVKGKLLFVFIVLALGAIAFLLLNFAMPNTPY